MSEAKKVRDYSQQYRKLVWLNIIPIILVVGAITVFVVPQQVKYAKSLIEQQKYFEAEDVLNQYIDDGIDGNRTKRNHFAYAYRAVNRIKLGDYKNGLDDAAKSVYFKWYFSFMNRSIHFSNPKYEDCQELLLLLDIEENLRQEIVRLACDASQNNS